MITEWKWCSFFFILMVLHLLEQRDILNIPFSGISMKVYTGTVTGWACSLTSAETLLMMENLPSLCLQVQILDSITTLSVNGSNFCIVGFAVLRMKEIISQNYLFCSLCSWLCYKISGGCSGITFCCMTSFNGGGMPKNAVYVFCTPIPQRQQDMGC